MLRSVLFVLPFVLSLPVVAQIALGYGTEDIACRKGLEAIGEGRYDDALRSFAAGLKTPSTVLSFSIKSMNLAAGVAHVLALQGRYDQSRRFLDSAFATMNSTAGGETGCPLATEFALLEMKAGNLNRARKAVVTCIDLAPPHRPPFPGSRYALDLLAQCEMDLGNPNAAENALRRAEAIWEKNPANRASLRVLRARLHRTASRYRRLNGDLVAAETAARAALEMHQNELAAENYDVALDEIEVAEVLRARGVPAQAEALYQTSFKALIHALGPGQPMAKQVLRRYADLLREQNRAKDLEQVEATLAKLPVIACTSCTPPVAGKGAIRP